METVSRCPPALDPSLIFAEGKTGRKGNGREGKEEDGV